MPSIRSRAAYRITVSYAALLAWTILLIGATVYILADNDLNRHDREEVAFELDRLAALQSTPALLRELHGRQSAPGSNRFTYAWIDSAGNDLLGAMRTSRRTLAPAKMGGSRPEIVSGSEGILHFSDGSRLVISRDAEARGRIKQMIFEAFLVASLAVLVISLLAGLLLGRYLRGKLRPISATASAITAGELNWRVPVNEPGDEFDHAGRSINLMLDRIDGLMENLRQVSSDIAHDLRKPLMRLLVQTDRLGRVDGAEQRIYELGDEMLMLFSGILRIAEVEGGGLEHTFQLIDLSALTTDVAESFEPAIADSQHRMEWTIAPGALVMGNRELLAQVVSNLLDNARIHTPSGTTISLKLRTEGTAVKLSVEDNGPGVSDENRGKLLQRFFRAEASRNTPGNGLGLSLVAAAAAAHSGHVEIEDAQPGLRVVVTLPIAAEVQ